MATYFHGNPEIPVGPDGGLQTMVLMNPTTYVQYNSTSDQNPHPPLQSNNNFALLNPSAAATAGTLFSSVHAPPTQQLDNVSLLHGFIPRMHYNLYGTPAYSPHQARDTPRAAQQGLSLSLSSKRQTNPVSSPGGSVSPGSGHATKDVISGGEGLVLSSKYLKAAQELLDEVVSVNNAGINYNKKSEPSKNSGDNNKVTGESTGVAGVGGGEAGGKCVTELTAVKRQEIQMKKTKLISMLDEVDQRYRQYGHQMQIIISALEQAAGIGSAKTYTSLALKTISKQFRALKEAITAQIRAANKSLGEEDGKTEGGSSRLKFVDHHLRQQRALQQLGMIQHSSAWRPQRGLPERAVSVLRAWLFEHFLHPYPKDSDKLTLAKQTGLTKSQVSNWFINARVRLWKPMVEEMYLEEVKEQEKRNGSEEKETGKSEQRKQDSTSKPIGYKPHQKKSTVSGNLQNSLMSKQDSSFMNNHNTPTSPTGGNFRHIWFRSSELEGITQGSPKKSRSSEMMESHTSVPSVNMGVNQVSEANHNDNNENISMKFRDERQYSFIENNTNFIGGFEQYPIGETGRFGAEPFTPTYSSNNGVSLTLGLPHCESFTVSGSRQNFLPNQNIGETNEFGAMNTSTPHSSAYNTISIQNHRRFAAQLLPDFVS